MSDTTEVVLVSGPNGPVRVNKSDFDADQATDNPQYKAYRGKEEAEQSVAGTTQINPDSPPLAAPSAPDFGGTDSGVPPTPMDPLKNAAAQTSASPNQRLVLKEGSKYYVVDGNGQKITDMAGIEPKGYKTDDEAWTAIRALPH